MTLWVGQDGTVNDDEGDGAAAPGSEGGYDDTGAADDTSADAGAADVADAGDAGEEVQADDGGDVVDEESDVDDTAPIAPVSDSVAIFEPSMYYPGEVVLFGGVPHFTRRYFERIGAMPRRRRHHRRFAMEREAPRLSFWEKIFGRRHHRPHMDREVAVPWHHRRPVVWERELIELRRLYPGRERELLEMHRLYPGREREMFETRIRREREEHARRTIHPAHPAHPDHPHHRAHQEQHPEHPGHPGHPGHPAHQPPTAAQAQAPHAVHPAQQAAAQQRGARVPMAPSALQPQQKPVVQPAKGAQAQAHPHPLPPSPEMQMQQQVQLGEHATSGTFTGWDYPLTDYNGYLFVDGPGQYWLWTITEPWLPPMNPPDYVPELFPPPPPPGMIAAMDLSPWEISRSNLFFPEEEMPEDAQPHITGLDFPFTDYFGNLILDAEPLGSGQLASMIEQEFYGPHVTGNGSLPMTDHWGNLLTAPHPFHIDYPWPPTMGGPVLTGYDTPFTDFYGRLLTNYGQYGNFTVENPWDWQNWDDVDLDRIDTEGDPQWFVVGQGDDIGASLGSAFGSALGSATGESSFGQAGKEIGSSIESGASSGDWGSALAAIGTSVAKVAIPALAKAGTDALTKATSQGGGGTTTQQGSPSVADVLAKATQQSAPQQRPAQRPARGAHAADPARNAMRSLVQQMTTLGQKYGIQRPGRQAQPRQAAPSGGS